VIEVRGEDAILVAIIDGTKRDVIPWRDLRDRARWLPGWR
jgi:ribosome modulation factor